MACIFTDYLSTCKGDNDRDLIQISEQRLLSVKDACTSRGDANLNVILESSELFTAHRNCLSTYTSKSHIDRHLKRKETNDNPTQPKRRKISRKPFFWKEECFFCGEKCEVKVDKRNPSRWRESYECRTADRGKGQDTFKDAILKVTIFDIFNHYSLF